MIEIIIPTSNTHNILFKNCYKLVEQTTKEIDILINICNANNSFSESINTVIKKSRAEYICLLNDDTEPRTEWLHWLNQRMKSAPNIGIVGSKLMHPGNKIIQQAGMEWDYKNNIPVHYGRGLPDYPEYNIGKDVFAVSFASVLIRKKMIDEIGLLDERYRYFFEDMDYCIHAKNNGWRIFYEPNSRVIHYESMTIKENNLSGEYETSKEIFLKKWQKMLSLKR